jgi:hypothetical protein
MRVLKCLGLASISVATPVARTGAHTIRLQVREDGIGIDEIVLSAVRYLSAAPGALKNDSTLLDRSR